MKKTFLKKTHIYFEAETIKRKGVDTMEESYLFEGKALLNLEEFCQYLGVGKTKGRELLRSKESTFTLRIGNRLYANKRLLDKWLTRRCQVFKNQDAI